MKPQRRIARVVTVPPLGPGFVGPGHLAAQVVSPEDFLLNDRFIVLMDDHLDIGDRTVGEPHPHAGFETVTLLLDGAICDRDEGGVIEAGEVQWMTAGRGIIHGENVATKGKVRLLQLWLTLPKDQRWTTPGFQPTSNNGFAYLIDGSIQVGGAVLNRGQIGWLDRPNDEGTSVLHVVSGEDGARLVLYAGQPQGDTIVSHGPLIGDSKEDIVRLYTEYRAGEFVRMTELATGRLNPFCERQKKGSIHPTIERS